MATIKTFKSICPEKKNVIDVASLPYDVYDRYEAYEIVKNNPYSFLAVDRAETTFENLVDIYSEEVYEKAALLLDKNISNGIYIENENECLYLYELVMNGRSQTGIVGCAAVDEYINGVIKKHENTRVEKEMDRTKHIDKCNAHTGPIFLAYRKNERLKQIIKKQKYKEPLYNFVSDDGVRHIVYKIEDYCVIKEIQDIFRELDRIYIADGHHRAAAAVNVARKRREEYQIYTGKEEFNYFLSVFFDEEELHIMEYNRVVKDLNGLTSEEFIEKLKNNFDLSLLNGPMRPIEKGTFTMFLDKKWYLCKVNSLLVPNDPVRSLDVSLLQDYLLEPILGITNPRSDKRIDFVGGIRGLEELEKRCNSDCRVAFVMYPTSIHELFCVSDANLLMPPKSTWFEPKLRSGLFIHKI